MALIDDILDKHARWIELEKKASHAEWERARKRGLKQLEAEGFAVRGLLARDDRSGMLGRSIVVFERTYGQDRGGFKLGSSDPVILRLQSDPENNWMRGVVHRLTARSAEIVFDDPPEAWVFDEVCAIELGPSEIMFERMAAGLAAMRGANAGLRALRDRVLGVEEVKAPKSVKESARAALNAEQGRALSILAAKPSVFLLHGPPGTGKTTTLSHAIAEATASGERVLAGAPSNQAVDNLAYALIARGVPVIRLGNPARLDPALLPHTLEGLLEKHPQKAVVDDLLRQSRKLFREASQKKLHGRALDAREQAFALRREAKQLLDEAKQIERRAVAHLLDTVPVILGTLTGLRDDVLGERSFDFGVIDEATQATTPAIYPLLSRVSRVAFGGDHLQLGPTVISREAASDGMERSVFERLMESKTPPPSLMLTVQYRMHADIMRYPSRALYGGALVAHASVAGRKLEGDWPALTFIDTAGRGFDEERADEATSYHNSGEAELALSLARKLVSEHGVAAADVGLLSPYDGQVQRLRALVGEDEFEINSIDGFQGREKSVIIVSLVRSNEKRDIGFLSEVRRLNVALTRAQRALIVIGDSATITSHDFYAGFVDDAIAHGAHKSAWEFSE